MYRPSDDDDWVVIALNEFLDRLHAKITMYDDHAELEGVIPLSIPTWALMKRRAAPFTRLTFRET